MPAQRLSNFLSRAGIASRRKADQLIIDGKVYVNNVRVVEPFFRVDPSIDVVTIDGKRVSSAERAEYFALYKPIGYISDLTDPRGRRLARGLIRSTAHLFPVGRLDYTSEGLMLFTNDGELANRIMHPRYEVEKEYLAKLKGRLSESEIERVLGGVIIEGERYTVRSVAFVSATTHNTWYRLVVTEGKNRMIRKIGDAIGHPVLRLRRLRIGPVTLRNLTPGQYRPLTAREVERLGGKAAEGRARRAPEQR